MYGIYSAERARQISEHVRQITERGGEYSPGERRPRQIQFVRLRTNLDAATDPLTGHTTATASNCPPTSADDTEREDTPSDPVTDITVINRDENFSVDISTDSPYLWVIEEEFEWIPLRSGGTGGGITILGTADTVDCPTGTLDVTPTYSSAGCAELPGLVYGVAPVVDILGIMNAYTLAELTGATVLAAYMYPVGDCTAGIWILWAVVATSGCK